MFYEFLSYPLTSSLTFELMSTSIPWNITKLVKFQPIIEFITNRRSFEFEINCIWLNFGIVRSQILSAGILLGTQWLNLEIRFQLDILLNYQHLLLALTIITMTAPKMVPPVELHSKMFYHFLDIMELRRLVKSSPLYRNVPS